MGGRRRKSPIDGLPIFWRLVLGFVVPSAVLVAIFGVWAYFQTTESADGEMGLRLAAVARAASVVVLPEELSFLEPGDEGSRTYRGLLRRLETLRRNTAVDRVYLFTPALDSIVDTQPGVAIGSHYYGIEVQRALLQKVARQGAGATLLYRGKDGRLYKTGFAVIRNAKGRVVAYSAVDAGATYFSAVHAVAVNMALAGGAALSLLLVITALLARRIAGPMRRLARAADRMGQGNLEEPLVVSGVGEVSLVASAMEKMRRDLHAREEELRLMLAGVAHEVRNPLAGMELSAGLLREDLAHDPELSAQVDEILADLDYLKRVVQDFLGYARWGPDRMEDCDILGLVHDAMGLVAMEAEQLGVSLELVDPGANSMAVFQNPVRCDPEPVRRTLVNLIKNAIQAAGEKGRVLVSIGVQPVGEGESGGDMRMVEIAVEDSGPGVAVEQRERIFDPFVTTKEKGSGLGLALAMKVARAHDGTVRCEAPLTLSGARFCLRLPVAGESRAGSAPRDGEKRVFSVQSGGA